MYTVPEILAYIKAHALTYCPGNNWEHFPDLTPEQAADLKAVCTAHNVRCEVYHTNGTTCTARVHHYADPDGAELARLIAAALNH